MIRKEKVSKPRTASTVPKSSTSSSMEETLQLGLQHHAAGRLPEALDAYRRVLEAEPNHADALLYLGMLYSQRSDFEQAAELLHRAVLQRPNDPMFHFSLGLAHQQAGDLLGAVDGFERALFLKPDYFEAATCLGNVCKTRGTLERAEWSYRRALSLKPDALDISINLATILCDCDRLGDAEVCIHEALRWTPDSAEGHFMLGGVLRLREEFDTAIVTYERAIALKPDYAEAWNGLGNTLRDCGRIDEASDAYGHSIDIRPDYAPAIYNLARCRRFRADDPIIPRIRELLHDPNLDNRDRSRLHFALGDILNDIGRYDDAFQQWIYGNRLERENVEFDIGGYKDYFESLRTAFSEETFGRHRGLGCNSTVPIFVVGMPRSGTTLAEQILASHSQVHGAGELTTLGAIADGYLARLANKGKYPGYIPDLPGDMIHSAGQEYVSRVRLLNDTAGHICDKMPQNFVHLGLIALALPRAKIVQCLRNPIDTCVSCFSTQFSKSLPYTHDLGELGSLYRLYRDLMAYWESVLPISFFKLRYEDLVSDQERTSRELLEFCGLPWDDRCLAFHKTERAILTASSVQVRRPIYSDSVERWRRYEKHLDALREALGRRE